MNLSGHFHLAQHPKRARWFMAIVWALITVKCGVVWWAMPHWNMPTHPIWVVGPTLIFAGLVTILWLAHREE